jgi:hypothetical protein
MYSMLEHEVNVIKNRTNKIKRGEQWLKQNKIEKAHRYAILEAYCTVGLDTFLTRFKLGVFQQLRLYIS